ncbi:MAG: glycosyltransferase family protein [Thermoleophilia bacterium]
MKSSLIYIILLNWHGWRGTLECLPSLEKLDYHNHRVLIVDNISIDDSVARIKAAYPDIPLIVNERNLGFGMKTTALGAASVFKASSHIRKHGHFSIDSMPILSERIGMFLYYCYESLLTKLSRTEGEELLLIATKGE